jgi:hypothetical protein
LAELGELCRRALPRRPDGGQPILQRQDLATRAARQQSLQRRAGGDKVVCRHVVELQPPGVQPQPQEALLAHYGFARRRPLHDHHDLARRIEHPEQQQAFALERRGDGDARLRQVDDQLGHAGAARHRGRQPGIGRGAEGRIGWPTCRWLDTLGTDAPADRQRQQQQHQPPHGKTSRGPRE